MNDPARNAADESNPEAQRLRESYAALIGQQDWQLEIPEGLPAESTMPTIEEQVVEEQTTSTDHAPPESSPNVPPPVAEAVVTDDVPPSPIQLIEAMLFVGGSPLTAERSCEVIRGLTPIQFREYVDILNRIYRLQNRPYAITHGEQGYSLQVRTRYRSVRERIFGGPREVRLNQPALDVLALIAYRQPITKSEIDSVRGADSGGIIRQLVRLGLASGQARTASPGQELTYGTTPRFLEVFGLRSLDDLPRLGETRSA